MKTNLLLLSALLSNLIGLYGINKKEFFKHPKREFAVLVGPEGYLPSTIIAFAEDELTLYFTSLIHQETCFVLPSKDIYLSIKKSNLSKIHIRFKNPGVYNFYCPAQDFTGQFKVYAKENRYDDYDFQSRKTIKKEKLIKMGMETKDSPLEKWRPKDH